MGVSLCSSEASDKVSPTHERLDSVFEIPFYVESALFHSQGNLLSSFISIIALADGERTDQMLGWNSHFVLLLSSVGTCLQCLAASSWYGY